MKLAAAQYPIDALADWPAFESKLSRWIQEAAGQGAQLLVMPEYGSMELAAVFGTQVCADLALQIERMQTLLPQWRALHAALARRHGVYLVGASFPVRESEGYVNRAHLFGPDGKMDWQDKLVMTRFENERWFIRAGREAKVFDTALGTLAINLCYDVEFPLIARAQVEAGARLLLVPSCTDTRAGYHRVRVGCQARALENQCVVVQAPTVGEASWSEAVDVNFGAAGVFGPPDRGFPDDGVLALGVLNQLGWVYAEVDLAEVDRVRQSGQVFNHRDWPRQHEALGVAIVRAVL